MLLSIKHMFLTLHSCLRMLLTFEDFSLSLPNLGTDIKMLFASLLQIMAKLRIPIVIFSGVPIVFKSFVPVRRMILSGFAGPLKWRKILCP